MSRLAAVLVELGSGPTPAGARVPSGRNGTAGRGPASPRRRACQQPLGDVDSGQPRRAVRHAPTSSSILPPRRETRALEALARWSLVTGLLERGEDRRRRARTRARTAARADALQRAFSELPRRPRASRARPPQGTARGLRGARARGARPRSERAKTSPPRRCSGCSCCSCAASRAGSTSSSISVARLRRAIRRDPGLALRARVHLCRARPPARGPA